MGIELACPASTPPCFFSVYLKKEAIPQQNLTLIGESQSQYPGAQENSRGGLNMD
jgi:hypothetical protein